MIRVTHPAHSVPADVYSSLGPGSPCRPLCLFRCSADGIRISNTTTTLASHSVGQNTRTVSHRELLTLTTSITVITVAYPLALAGPAGHAYIFRRCRIVFRSLSSALSTCNRAHKAHREPHPGVHTAQDHTSSDNRASKSTARVVSTSMPATARCSPSGTTSS